MKEKSALDRQREAAISLQIKSRGQDHATHIVEMFPIKGQLYAFKEDSVFLVQTPDDIDPARQHPEIKGATTRIYDIGTRHPVVARTIIQAKRLMDSVILKDGLSKDDLVDEYFLFFRELASCNLIYESLVGVFLEEAEGVQEALEASWNTQFVGDIPQIPNLEDQARSFFLTAHKAIKKLSCLTELFFPEKPKGQNFEQLCGWLLESLGSDNHLYRMILSDLDWLKVVWEVRNAIEHRGSPRYHFEVRNVEMGPNCTFYAPRWRYAFPGKQQEEFVDLFHDLEVYVSNMVSLGEELVVLCVQETWNKNFPFAMFKRRPEDLDPACPVQYGVTIHRGGLPQRP
jgi:hypothetical protein